MSNAAGAQAPPLAAPPPPGWRTPPAARLAVLRALTDGALADPLGDGPVGALERAVAVRLRLPEGRVRAAGSGSGALVRCLVAAGVAPGREVVLSALAPAYVAGAVMLVGAQPVAADVGPDLALDAAAVARRLGRRTAAVVWTPPPAGDRPLAPLAALCAGARVPLVEDGAHLFGLADTSGRPVGGRAPLAAFSLAYGKGLHAGEGGLAIARGARTGRRLADHAPAPGRGRRRLPPLAATGRMGGLAAALAAASLPDLDERWRRRQAHAARLAQLGRERGVADLGAVGVPLWAGRLWTGARARQLDRDAAPLRLEFAVPAIWPGAGPGLPAAREAAATVRVLAWWDAAVARPAEWAVLERAFVRALEGSA